MTEQQQFTPEQKLKHQLSRSKHNLDEVVVFMLDIIDGDIEPTKEMIKMLKSFTEEMSYYIIRFPYIIKKAKKKLKHEDKNVTKKSN